MNEIEIAAKTTVIDDPAAYPYNLSRAPTFFPHWEWTLSDLTGEAKQIRMNNAARKRNFQLLP